MPSPKQPDIVTVLDRMEALLIQLREEPWAEYDKTLTAACTIHAKRALGSLQVVAKAVSRISPAESRDSTIVPGFEWVGETLDRTER